MMQVIKRNGQHEEVPARARPRRKMRRNNPRNGSKNTNKQGKR
jgi:hypothetical protein